MLESPATTPPATDKGPPAIDKGPPGAAGASLRQSRFLPRSAFALDPAHGEAFAKAIEAFAAHHAALADPLGSGGLIILDLAEIRRRFVNRWPKVRAKAGQIVEGILAQRLGPNDRYVTAGEDRFLLLITDVDRKTAEREGQRVAAEITERLCGRAPGGVAARSRRSRLDLATGLAGIADLATLERRLAELEVVASPPAPESFAHQEPELLALWVPMLNLAKRLISAYALTACRAVEGGSTPLALADADEVYLAELDRWSIGRAEAPLGQGRAGLVVPLHFSSLKAMRHREPLLIACRRLPKSAGRRLVVEIAKAPPGLPQARLHEIVRFLRPLCAGIALRVDGKTLADGQALADRLVGTGIKALTLDLAAADSAADPTAEDAAMAALAAMTRRLKLRSLVHVGADRRRCRAALAAGIGHIAGSAVFPATTSPGRAILLAAR